MFRGAIRFIKTAIAEVFGNPAEYPWDERSYGDLPHLPPECGNARVTLGGLGFDQPAEFFQIEDDGFITTHGLRS